MNNEARIQILNPEDNSEYTTDAILRGARYPDEATGLLREDIMLFNKVPGDDERVKYTAGKIATLLYDPEADKYILPPKKNSRKK
ncbi:hypothetical protein TM074_02080 [Candidatus Nanosynbacter sp. TM7-074]|uniref:Uncharacterized protein n=1 Tax=Candidatus Nanosynbacter sp. TM7-074 TaxID=3158573 RepID=A0AB39J9V7_9BACT